MMRLILFVLFCTVVTGCATTSLPPVTSKNFAFEDDEKRLWIRSEEEEKVINKSGFIYHDEELERYLNDVVRKLQPPEVYEHIPFEIMVIKDYHLNAFALPNGVVYIHTGMLARMDNEAQLATVLAHETTHSTHRHAVKNIRNIKNKTAFFSTMQVTLGGFTGGMADILGAIGTMAAVSGYSKELETEADTEGLKLMVNAGYNPSEAPKLFMHLKKEVEEEKTKEPFFFGTHPRLQERIDNYNTLLQSYYPGQKGIDNRELFLEKVNKVVIDNASLDLKAGRYSIAQREVEKYLDIKPNEAQAYYLLGEIARKRGEKGDAEKAMEHYEKAISINTTYPEPYKGMGFLYYKQDKKELAKKYFEQYLTLSPGTSDRTYIEEYIKSLP